MKYWQIGIWLFALLLCASCTDSEVDGGGEKSDEEIYLTLSLNMPGGHTPATRGFTPDQESAVNNLRVLVFKEEGEATGDNALFAYNAPVTKLLEGGTVTVQLRKSTAGEKYRLMLLANTANPVRPLTTADTRSVARALFGFGKSYRSLDYKKGLPMHGESATAQVVTDEATTSFGAITLKRAVARIDVGLGFTSTVNGGETCAGLPGFALTTLTAYNATDTGYIAPVGIPEGAGKAKPLYDATNNEVYQELASIRTIYLPEAKNTTDDTGTTPLPAGQRCCLVLGGRFDANANGTTADDAVSYYRVDFVDAADKQMDLVRNSRYVVDVTKVGGAGFPTADDAFLAGPMNITVSINAWSESNQDMVYDGQHYFQAESRTVLLPHGTNQRRAMTVGTDVPVASWKWLNAEAWSSYLRVECAQTAITFVPLVNTVPPLEMSLQVSNLTVTFNVKSQTSLTPGSVELNDWMTPMKNSILASPAHGIVGGMLPGDEGFLPGGELDGGNVGKVTKLGGDLPAECANCYLVLPGREYDLPATYEGNGNGTSSVVGTIVPGTRAGARVVWQSAPGLVTDARYDANIGYIRVRTGNAARTRFWNSATEPVQVPGGNAVVAVTAADGTILWSWHLWVVANVETRRTILAGTGTGNAYMDRNLGALGNKSADKVLAYGLLYQWGRNAPFPASCLWQGNAEPELYDGSNRVVKIQRSYPSPEGTFTYAAKMPLTFLFQPASGDWLTTPHDGLWANPDGNLNLGKTLFDPCPVGWKVAHGSAFSGSGSYVDGGGVTVPTQGGYFPLVGLRNGPLDIANRGYYWTSVVSAAQSIGVTIDGNGHINPSYPYNRLNGFSVRCIKE